MSEWRSIRTAPEDQLILLYEYGDMYAGKWESIGGYWSSFCGQPVIAEPEPSHWMPLPDPPEDDH
jgi:hypothetical protein